MCSIKWSGNDSKKKASMEFCISFTIHGRNQCANLPVYKIKAQNVCCWTRFPRSIQGCHVNLFKIGIKEIGFHQRVTQKVPRKYTVNSRSCKWDKTNNSRKEMHLSFDDYHDYLLVDDYIYRYIFQKSFVLVFVFVFVFVMR